MALIKCAECGKEISDLATACPGCGSPIRGVRTIESTGKKFKGLWLLGWFGLIGGIVAVYNEAAEAGIILAVLGACAIIYAKVGAWWYHA